MYLVTGRSEGRGGTQWMVTETLPPSTHEAPPFRSLGGEGLFGSVRSTLSRQYLPQIIISKLITNIITKLNKALTPPGVSIEAALDKKLEKSGASLRTLKADNGRLDDHCKVIATENAEDKTLLAVCS